MKLHYFISLGLLVSLHSFVQANDTVEKNVKQKTDIEAKQKVDEKNKEAIDGMARKAKRKKGPQEEKIELKNEPKQEPLLGKYTQGSLSSLAALGAVATAALSIYNVHHKAKQDYIDYTRVYGNAFALLYLGALAGQSAYDAFMKA
jgi:hypothetical protein